ncbi:hypothetical protein BDAP_000223 [Binucleata daphniae]
MRQVLIKYLYFVNYFLNNKDVAVVESNFKILNNCDAITINPSTQKEAPWTLLMYPSVDMFASFVTVTDVPVTLVIDYHPNLNILSLINVYSGQYKIENVILLNKNNDKQIYTLKKDIVNKTKICMIAVDQKISNEMKAKYDPEKIVACKMYMVDKIQNRLLILFYLILISFLVVLYLTLRVYLNVQRKKDPVITDLELDTCKVMKYREINEKQLEECLVCMENYTSEDNIRVLHCEHYYHKKCIDPWLLNKSARCPYCRTLIKIDI